MANTNSTLEAVRLLLQSLQEQGYSQKEIADLVLKQEEVVPVAIFSTKIPPLKALVKYLKDNRTYSEIAKVLNRNERTIWTSYNSLDVRQKKIKLPVSDISIPLSIFSTKKTVLTALVEHLSKTYSTQQIASMLNRHYQTIASVKRRGQNEE